LFIKGMAFVLLTAVVFCGCEKADEAGNPSAIEAMFSGTSEYSEKRKAEQEAQRQRMGEQ